MVLVSSSQRLVRGGQSPGRKTLRNVANRPRILNESIISTPVASRSPSGTDDPATVSTLKEAEIFQAGGTAILSCAVTTPDELLHVPPAPTVFRESFGLCLRLLARGCHNPCRRQRSL